jgi:esterase/lipase
MKKADEQLVRFASSIPTLCIYAEYDENVPLKLSLEFSHRVHNDPKYYHNFLQNTSHKISFQVDAQVDESIKNFLFDHVLLYEGEEGEEL